MSPAILRALPLVILLALAPASTAGAATFTPADGDALQAAFTQAESNGEDDTVTLAAEGLYTRGTGGHFTYDAGEAKTLTLIGNGATVNAPSGTGFPTIALAGGTIDVSGLNVLMEGAASVGFLISDGPTTATVDDVRVTGVTSDSSARGIELAGAITATNLVSSAAVGSGIVLGGPDVTLEGGLVTGAGSRQIEVAGGNATITDVVTREPATAATTGLEVDEPTVTATARRLRISGSSTGAAALFGGTLTLTDSLLELAGTSASGLLVGDFGNNGAFDGTITADRLTIAGSGADGQRAASVGGGSAAEADHGTVTLRGSIVTGVPLTFVCGEGNAQTQNTISVFATALPADATDANDCADLPSDAGITLGAGVTTLEPVFADGPGGDYRPTRTSPLIDLGANADPLVGADLAGGVRYVGDAVDLGAYEYQRSAPAVTAGGTPAAPVAGRSVSLVAVATDADPGETAQLTYAWTFSDGGTATGPAPLHIFQAIGPASATVAVTDPTGQTTVESVQLNVVAPPPGSLDQPTGSGPAGSTEADSTAPKLTALRVTRTIRRGARLPGSVARGGQLRFTLSEAATVRARFERAKGRRFVRVPGAITLKLAAGRQEVRFSGRLSRTRALKPGAYRVVLTPTDPTGNTGGDVRATFTLR